MERVKKFFSITEKEYKFEWYDVTAFVTILNVMFIVVGMWWAPFFGLLNCAICLALNVKGHAHINAYFTQVALIILNIFFLTM